MADSSNIHTTASLFINSTSSHIFLTGKAGTGKTTFLKNLGTITHKTFIVVAPTGIAALNAGGSTIHSQFLFPFGMFLPEAPDNQQEFYQTNFFTPHILALKHPLNSERKQILRSIDMLVIDEVSMVRPDLLDAIDYRLRAARNNFRQSFGGVQVLFIGDLYQLPPVVKRQEEQYLSKYYPNYWFFQARALQDAGLVYLELDKIYRQHDDKFIYLLNNLRNNTVTREDIDQLNAHYKTAEEIEALQEVITLTTHNQKADDINETALEKLTTPSKKFQASITGTFPEHIYPVLATLTLKVGTQIMFVKNDAEERKYFNGKLATVIAMDNDSIEVSMAETHQSYTLKKHTWENKQYTYDAENQDMIEEVIGTFEQFPIKLAWAITVHKSQGLTFERAIIDVKQAFADGQVYVALSRLRSLDGLILRTRIDSNVISTDRNVVQFSKENNHPEKLPTLIKERQFVYMQELIDKTFDFDPIIKEIAHLKRSLQDEPSFSENSMKPVPEQISIALLEEAQNTTRFRHQLHYLLSQQDFNQMEERLTKGKAYYTSFMHTQLKLLLQHIEEVKQKKKTKTYLNWLQELDQLLFKKTSMINHVVELMTAIINNETTFSLQEHKRTQLELRTNLLAEVRENLPNTQKKKEKTPTAEITRSYLAQGKSIAEIAEERALAIGTIESHVLQLISNQSITITDVLPNETMQDIMKHLEKYPDQSAKEIFEHTSGRFSYFEIRCALKHRALEN
jgi:hypothetical protein